MKLLCISDLHTFSIKVIGSIPKNLEIDCIILLGDVSESYFINLKETFLNIPIIAILGNHDYPYVFDRHDYIENIHNKSVAIKNTSFAGLEGIVKYEDENYPGFTQSESIDLSNKIPAADILITHTSPYGYHEKDKNFHAGLKGINTYLDRYKPKLLLHGHQHINIEYTYNDTKVFCIYGISLVDTEKKTRLILKED